MSNTNNFKMGAEIMDNNITLELTRDEATFVGNALLNTTIQGNSAFALVNIYTRLNALLNPPQPVEAEIVDEKEAA